MSKTLVVGLLFVLISFPIQAMKRSQARRFLGGVCIRKRNLFLKRHMCSVNGFSDELFRYNKRPGRAIVFDLEGTIVNTDAFWFPVLLNVLNDFDIELSKEEEDELLTLKLDMPITDRAAWLIDRYNKTSINKDDIYDSYYFHGVNSDKEIDFVPGFRELHRFIQKLGVRSAVATNYDKLAAQIIIQNADLEYLFGKHIYDKEDVKHDKPAPDVYLLAAHQIGIDPSHCIAIDDSRNGVKSAKNAGMFCIGLNEDPEEVEEADLVVSSYYEIDIKKLCGKFSLEK